MASTSSAWIPDEISLEAFNSNFLQRHSSSASAILAVAKVHRATKAPQDVVDNTLFTLFTPDVHLDVKVSQILLTLAPFLTFF
jgi:N-alpha-acetyltransferase 15/16, NatA auxiliary subunit